jgi:hypothetical protein
LPTTQTAAAKKGVPPRAETFSSKVMLVEDTVVYLNVAWLSSTIVCGVVDWTVLPEIKRESDIFPNEATGTEWGA